MNYTSDEINAWSNISTFFEPSGIIDSEAIKSYLTPLLAKPRLSLHNSFQNALPHSLIPFLTLLKKIDTPEAVQVFATLYNATRPTSDLIQPWLNDMAQGKPEVLKKWLQQIVGILDVTSQILLMRDVKHWFPEEDIRQYTSKSILTIKPALFVKKFTPAIEDMPTLLSIAKTFRQENDYKNLGLLLEQGVFTSMYGKEARGGSAVEIKYRASDAFSLMQKLGTSIEPKELMAVVALRYKGPSLTSDALAYCLSVFQENSTVEEKEYGKKVLNVVLDAHHNNPTPSYMPGLCRVYHVLKSDLDATELRTRIHEEMIIQVNNAAVPFQHIESMLTYASDAIPILLETIQQRDKDKNYTALIRFFHLGFHDNESSVNYHALRRSQKEQAVQIHEIIQQLIDPSDLLVAMETEFVRLLADTIAQKKTGPYVQNGLNHLMSTFSCYAWDESKMQAIKSNPIIPKIVLSYLCASMEQAKASYSRETLFSPLEIQPIPFLRSLYPEHNQIWNSMQKTMLQTNMSNSESYVDLNKQLFTLFSATFIPSKPTTENMLDVCASIGSTPIEYVLSMCETAHALSFENLNTNMFEMEI